MKNSAFLLLPAWLLSSAAGAADLLSVYHDAVAYDAQFAAARANLDAGREKINQGRAGLLPSIGLSGNTMWNDVEISPRSNVMPSSTMKYNSNGWTASLSQPLFRWQNWSTYKQGELSVGISESQFAAARQDLLTRVAQAYFDVLLAEETAATAAAQRTAITEQLEAAKRNFEVGTSTITDTHEAQARYDLAVAAELAAQNDIIVKHEVLRLLVGKDPGVLKSLKAGSQISRPQPDDVAAWAESASTGNLSVAAAEGALAIAEEEIGKQRAGHYPTVDLVASYGQSGTGYYSQAIGGVDNKSTVIGMQFSVPIFAGGLVSSKEREVVALREKARNDLDNARRQAALGARQAYLGVTSGLAQIKAYEAALASSQSSLDSNKLGYDVGVRINIDVLNAQSQLYDTRQKLTKARLDTLMAQIKLKAAAGNLSEEDLAGMNAILE